MFEKYGERYWINEESGQSSILNLSTVIGGLSDKTGNTNKVLSKYIDIMDKLAQRDPAGMKDAVRITSILEWNAESMSEATALKFIKGLKRTSFQQQDGLITELALNRASLGESEKIKSAVADLKESLKDFPYIDTTVNG